MSSSNVPLTQRSLAQRHGVALGLANLLIRRLTQKGFIKIKSVKGDRLRYLITPQGITEKARLTCEFVDYSLHFYRHARQFFTGRLTDLLRAQRRSIVIAGTGEIAEIAYLTIRELGLDLAGVFDHGAEGRTFFKDPVRPMGELAGAPCDAIIIASIPDRDALYEQLVQAGISSERIIVIPEHV